MFELDEPSDPDDQAAQEAFEQDAIRDAVLTEMAAARAGLQCLFPGMDRGVRWRILDRFYAASVALQTELDRVEDHGVCDRIVREIRGAV